MTSEPSLGLPKLGGYEIVGLLGTGGMAQVLLGRQTGPSGFERPVVIKRILPHLVRHQSFVDMFLDEARIIANIRHPNVVNIHDFRYEDGELFMVMEYLEGETTASLRRRLSARDERLPTSLWCHIFAQTCAGLHAAHQATNETGLRMNLVHRDVSPPNILVTYDGAVKLIDFGIAKSDYRSSQTDAGHIKGKYAYMSPEQARGKTLDARSDVFSLGIVMFEMTTGQRLFKRNTDLLTVKAVCEEPIPDPRTIVPDYPESLHQLCLKALSRDPAERHQSALELRRDLLTLIRADDSSALPEELIGVFMQDMFEDRIELKRGLLQRVRDGERFDTFSSTTDSVIEVSTLMTGALPKIPKLTNNNNDPAPPIDDEPSVKPNFRDPVVGNILLAPIVAAFVLLIALILASAVDSNKRRLAAEVPVTNPAKTSTSVRLGLASDPADAVVLIGGEPQGRTPLELNWTRSDNSIQLVFQRDGYEDWSTVVTPNRDVIVKGKLTKVVPEQRPRSRIRRAPPR